MVATDKNGNTIEINSFVFHQNLIDQVTGFSFESFPEIKVYLRIAKEFVLAKEVELYKPSLQLE